MCQYHSELGYLTLTVREFRNVIISNNCQIDDQIDNAYQSRSADNSHQRPVVLHTAEVVGCTNRLLVHRHEAGDFSMARRKPNRRFKRPPSCGHCV